MDSEFDVLSLHATYTASGNSDQTERMRTYRDALFHYAADVISEIATKRSEQWDVLAHLEPGLCLFTFQNHTRIYFSRRGDRLSYKFKTSPVFRRLGPFNFRVLWVVQSPVFQDSITATAPILDKGNIYLTFCEAQDAFNIRVCWTEEHYVPEGEVLVQSLAEYDVERSSDTAEVVE